MKQTSGRSWPPQWTRRRFLQRCSLVALGTYAGLVGAGPAHAYAFRRLGQTPPPPEIDASCASCVVLECGGCACGGDYYHCFGCGGQVDYRRCYTGHRCSTFCGVPCN